MGSQRTHQVTTSDGVAIVGTVHGHGPPVVFLPGGIGDGDLDWQALVPHLTGRFTCYLPSLRGRGLSGDHPDLRLRRLVDDLVAYVDSIGEATGLVGWSAGGMALAVAARSAAVDAVVAVEPTIVRVMNDGERAALGAADEAGYFDAAGRYVPTVLNQLGQTMRSEGPDVGDPGLLGAISAPLLLLHGSDTKRFLADGARHVAEHVPDARVQEIPGAGHAAPLTHPEALGEALAEFFSPTRPARRPEPDRLVGALCYGKKRPLTAFLLVVGERKGGTYRLSFGPVGGVERRHAYSAGRYRGGGTAMPRSRAATSHASFARSTSSSAACGLVPNAEQASRSGMSRCSRRPPGCRGWRFGISTVTVSEQKVGFSGSLRLS